MSFESYGIHIHGSGAEVRTICPQCSPNRKKSKDQCLAVNTIEGVWLCHHCGWSGSLKKSDTKPIPYESKQALPEKVIQYFESRGIPQGILEQERIGLMSLLVRVGSNSRIFTIPSASM